MIWHTLIQRVDFYQDVFFFKGITNIPSKSSPKELCKSISVVFRFYNQMNDNLLYYSSVSTHTPPQHPLFIRLFAICLVLFFLSFSLTRFSMRERKWLTHFSWESIKETKIPTLFNVGCLSFKGSLAAKVYTKTDC